MVVPFMTAFISALMTSSVVPSTSFLYSSTVYHTFNQDLAVTAQHNQPIAHRGSGRQIPASNSTSA